MYGGRLREPAGWENLSCLLSTHAAALSAYTAERGSASQGPHQRCR